MPSEACERDEFRTPVSPAGLEVVQISTDDTRDSTAFYLDCQSWASDSSKFVYHRHASDDGSKKPGFWLCDTENNFASYPVYEYENYRSGFEESGNSEYGCVLGPTGECAYLLERKIDRVVLSRLEIDGRARKVEICRAPAPLVSRGALSISADGERLLMGNFLGDGKTEGAPWGADIFDLKKGAHWVIEFGNGYRNMHCQYSRNPAPEYSHDILLCASQPILSDGSWLTPPDGSWRWQDMPPDDGLGGAHHIVKDDGSDWRLLPIGRRKDMLVGGHCTWRGSEYSVCAAVYNVTPERWRSPIIEAEPTRVENPEAMWLGADLRGAEYVDLCRKLARADTCHFGFDRAGGHFVSDTDGYHTGEYSFVYAGTYVEPEGESPYLKTSYLLLPRTSWKSQSAHPHPYLSPDGKYAVFQSDFTGRPQVCVAYNFTYP